MGQTLTHGIYLPDEGERNCYNGLAGNWQLLDGAVGTIAEHTTALSGKAPLVHTHTVSQITDFPVYGTTAGTICEGNDSRLSDARTPVAHTHGKADITDLFNSANVWSAENQFTNITRKFFSAEKGTIPSSNNDRYEYIKDKNGVVLGYRQFAYNTAGSLSYIIWLQNSYTNNQLDPNGSDKVATFGLNLKSDGSKVFSIYADALPNNDNSFNLGLSNRRWKSLNGINPGALSLPNGNAQDSSWIGDLTVKDGSDYNLKTFILNGWITINIPNTAGNLVVVNNGCGQIVTNEANGITGNNCAVFIPVVANVQISILLVLQAGESVKTAIFAPCLGNV